jgi:hypothetical protein
MRQAYTRPIVSIVDLVSDQAVLAACKTGDVGGGQGLLYPGSINCEAGSSQCYSEGS